MQLSATQPRLGKYELIERLGLGGMAEVWRARVSGAAGFEKEVAVKLLHPAVSEDGRLVSMFINEARLSARLHHPNVVQTLDFGLAAGRYFIAMELVDGIALRQAPPLDRATAVYVVAELAAALDYAYEAPGADGAPLRLVHRDVNPSNVMISSHGAVLLADFGIARAAGHGVGTEAGTLKGKFQYMSPEQAWGRPLDGRSDICALGLLLYELALGRRAIQGDSEIELLERARAGVILPEGCGLDGALAAILARALALDPADRPATAGALRRELQEWLAQAPHRDYRGELERLIRGVARPAAALAQPPAMESPSGPATAPLGVEEPPARRWWIGPVLLTAAGLGLAFGGFAWVEHARSRAVLAAMAEAAAHPPAPPPVNVSVPVEHSPAPPVAAPASPVEHAPPLHAHAAADRGPPSAPDGAPATLRIRVVPWGNVWLDERALGMTPLHSERVAAGTHQLRVEHPQLGVQRRSLKLGPGEARLVTVDFHEAAQ